MNLTTKKALGQLLDKDNQMLLAKTSVTINLLDPLHPNDRPRYEVSLTVNGYRPELDNKTHLLTLGDDLVGEVFI